MNQETKLLPEKEVITLQRYFKNLCILNSAKEDDADDEGISENEDVNLDGNSQALKKLLRMKKGKDDCKNTITISDVGIKKFPNVIFCLKYLRALDLSNNLLETLPKEIGNLCNLVILKLNGNCLSSLPKSIKQVTSLNFLDISCNKFVEVPEVLYYGLRGLRVLDISVNKIKIFNDAPGCLNKLTVLNLSKNFLNEFPAWIFDNLCQLEFLDCSKNHFHLYTNAINYYNTGIFDSLKLLKIENCNLNLGSINIFSYLKSIEILQAGNSIDEKDIIERKNYFGNLFTEKYKILETLKCFYIQNTKIGFLPSNIDCLKNIELIDLSWNLLSWLPESFCNLTGLKIINLSSNQLLFLPSNIGNLINLKQFFLGNNKLTCIPESFYNLNNLEFVDFYNNQIEQINLNILKKRKLKGLDLGMNYLQSDVDDSMLYNSLKDSFRKHFFKTEARCDLQMSKQENCTEASESHDSECSLSSFENDSLSGLECSNVNVIPEFVNGVEDWENENFCLEEKDESFDPNCVKALQHSQVFQKLELKNNYCPANYHAPSVMKKFLKKFKLASKYESVEGQFDSN